MKMRCYVMEDCFIQCRGVVIGTCFKTHDPENGRDIRICRLPVEARPRRGLQFAALSREAYDVGGEAFPTGNGDLKRFHVKFQVRTPR